VRFNRQFLLSDERLKSILQAHFVRFISYEFLLTGDGLTQLQAILGAHCFSFIGQFFSVWWEIEGNLA
jgi:hypothetical protein